MKTKQEYKKTNIRKAAIIVGFFLLVAVALIVIKKIDTKQTGKTEEISKNESSTITVEGTGYVLNENVETVLLVGLDKFYTASSEGYRNPNCADFVTVLAINHVTESYKAIQISRDTYTDVEVITINNKNYVEKMQLALSYTYGSGTLRSLNNTAKSVTNLLCGIEMDKKISAKMDVVPILNDMVSGVTLTVLDDYTNLDPSLVKGKEVTLSGEQALLYVRARAGMEDSSNDRRMERQRQYLNALYKEMVKSAEGNESFGLEAITKVSEYLVSDCVNVELTELFEQLSTYDFEGIVSLEGETKVGEEYMEFHPDMTKLKTLVAETFYVKQ